MLAYLPQHVFQVAAIALGASLVCLGLPLLVSGRDRETPQWSRRTARAVGLLQVLAGVTVGSLAFLVDAEAPGNPERDHWGGTDGIVLLALWLLGLAAIVGSIVKRRRQ